MKHKLISLLLFCMIISSGYENKAEAAGTSQSLPNPDPCEFKAKVIPKEKTEKIKAIYRETCEWFIQVFQAVPSPDIPLNDVKFVESWNSIKYIKNKNNLNGIFHSNHIKEINEIAILSNIVFEYWRVTPLWYDSVLVHEIIHYLTKSSSWDTLSKVDRMNYAIQEAHAYWSQDQYIRRNSEGKLTLNDFIIDKDEENVVDTFEFSSIPLYKKNKNKYLYNAILWFDIDPKGIFEGIVNGKYIAHSLYFQ